MEGQIRTPRLSGPRAKSPIPEDGATCVSKPPLAGELLEPKCRGYVLVGGTRSKFVEHYGWALKNLGFTPLFALKCEVTSAYLRLFIFDFVLLDHERWDLEGWALLDETRRLEHKTPILVVVHRQDMQRMNAAQQVGVLACQLESASYSELEKVIYGLPYSRESATRPSYQTGGAPSPPLSEGAGEGPHDGKD